MLFWGTKHLIYFWSDIWSIHLLSNNKVTFPHYFIHHSRIIKYIQLFHNHFRFSWQYLLVLRISCISYHLWKHQLVWSYLNSCIYKYLVGSITQSLYVQITIKMGDGDVTWSCIVITDRAGLEVDSQPDIIVIPQPYEGITFYNVWPSPVDLQSEFPIYSICVALMSMLPLCVPKPVISHFLHASPQSALSGWMIMPSYHERRWISKCKQCKQPGCTVIFQFGENWHLCITVPLSTIIAYSLAGTINLAWMTWHRIPINCWAPAVIVSSYTLVMSPLAKLWRQPT